MLALCESVMRTVCADFNTTLTEFTGEDDHVHVLIEYPPTVQISKIVNSLKGVSARKLRAAHRDWVDQHSINGHLWSPSYLAASSGAPTPIIDHYITQQRRPPRTPGRPKSTR